MRGDREKCLDSGMDMYIAKPLDKQELFQALERCAASQLRPIQEPTLQIAAQSADAALLTSAGSVT